MVIRFIDGKLAVQSKELRGELGRPEEAIRRLLLMGISDRIARQIVYEAMMTGSANLPKAVNF
jgi:hypothetical protein